MSVKERILMLRLMSRLETHPAYAKKLGIEADSGQKNSRQDREGLTKQ